MPKINILPEDLANKIAAGEVVERPASVVKELVENALDAGASEINVEIKDAGKELIKVTDNGEGMDKADARKAVLRHATSKIKVTDDLFNIISLGFRGEALASIAAVSRLSIETKQEPEIEGFQVHVDGGVINKENIIATNKGTVITIKDLFFNTPARKKFLKSDLIELRHIIDIVTKYALANPEISFTLVNEGKELLSAPSTQHQRDNIAYVYGPTIAKELLRVSHLHKEGVKVEGYFSKPLSARNDKNQQALFVNGRWVKNSGISQGIYDAYHSILFTGKHPIYVLNVTLDPKSIDVNVHPNKTEIKIEQKELVYEAVYQALHGTLKKNNLIPTLDIETDSQITFGTPKAPEKKSSRTKYAFEKSEQTVFPKKGAEVKVEAKVDLKGSMSHDELDKNSYRTLSRVPQVKESVSATYSATVPETKVPETVLSPQVEKKVIGIPVVSEHETDETFIPGSVKFPEMKILGQIHKTFFVAETPGGMLLIDQHVVQERVLYERFMQHYLNKHVETQVLLEKDLLTFTTQEKLVVIEYLERLKGLGFALEHFGENDFWLSSVPTLLGRTQGKELVYTIVKELGEGKVKEIENIQEEIITMMACRASVKAGNVLTIPQIKKLMRELVDCELPYTCPHGRAIVVRIDAEELEKKFLRHS